MSVAPAKLPEVKSVYEKNKRSNNICQIIKLLDHNIKHSSTLDKFRDKPDEFLFHPIHCEDLCFLTQKELKDFKKVLQDKGGTLQSMANKFVTLTGASQSLTSFQLEKRRQEKVMKQREIQQKRMEIIQNCPSLAEFYDTYLTKNAKKSQGEIEFEQFVAQYPKRFKGYDQFLFMPEKKVIHKNSRFVRFDDVDMGDEVEAAIYNDGGKSAPLKLKKYVNEQMDRIMGDKMNQHNYQLKADFMEPTIEISDKKRQKNHNGNSPSDSKIDVSLLIERSKILVGDSDKNLNFNKLIQNINNYQRFHKQQNLKHSSHKPTSPNTVLSNRSQLSKKSMTKSISMTELKVLEKYRSVVHTPLSQAQTDETMANGGGTIVGETDILMPAVSKISLILDPKSHDNFLNMIVKNQVRLQTSQGPRIETPQSTSNAKNSRRIFTNRNQNHQQLIYGNRPQSMQFRIKSNSSLLKPFQNNSNQLIQHHNNSPNQKYQSKNNIDQN